MEFNKEGYYWVSDRKTGEYAVFYIESLQHYLEYYEKESELELYIGNSLREFFSLFKIKG